MQARYYSPIAGRMLSVDPVSFASIGDPRYMNRYMYAGNDPVNMWDPDGRQTCGYGDSDSCKGAFKEIASNIGEYLAPRVKASLDGPEAFKEGAGKGVLNVGAETINGAVALGEAVNPAVSVGQSPDIPTFRRGSNLVENFGMTVGETGTNVALSAAAAPRLASSAGALANASRGSLGKCGVLFGRGGRSGGTVFNSSYVRVGYGWKGKGNAGSDIIRFAVGNKGDKFHVHVTLYTFKNPAR